MGPGRLHLRATNGSHYHARARGSYLICLRFRFRHACVALSQKTVQADFLLTYKFLFPLTGKLGSQPTDRPTDTFCRGNGKLELLERRNCARTTSSVRPFSLCRNRPRRGDQTTTASPFGGFHTTSTVFWGSLEPFPLAQRPGNPLGTSYLEAPSYNFLGVEWRRVSAHSLSHGVSVRASCCCCIFVPSPCMHECG